MEKYAIGIDVGGTKINTSLVNSEGRIIEKRYVEHKKNFTVDDVISTIFDEVGMLIMNCSVDPDFIMGIGMGLPGIVDYRSGTVIKMPNIKNGDNINFKELIEDKFSIPVFLDNDVNVALLAEKWVGAGKPFESIVMFAVGTGLGGGIYLNGDIYRGHTFSAAELGHMVVKYDGKKCTCGGYGCLEEYASGRAIVKTSRDFLNSFPDNSKKIIMELLGGDLNNLSARYIFEAAMLDDPASITIIDTFATILGIGIANIINILNPEAIIVGGAVATSYDKFCEKMIKAVELRNFSDWKGTTKILHASLGADAGVIGAAGLILTSPGIQ